MVGEIIKKTCIHDVYIRIMDTRFLYRDAARLLFCSILYELEFVEGVSCFHANREGT